MQCGCGDVQCDKQTNGLIESATMQVRGIIRAFKCLVESALQDTIRFGEKLLARHFSTDPMITGCTRDTPLSESDSVYETIAHNLSFARSRSSRRLRLTCRWDKEVVNTMICVGQPERSQVRG